MLQRSIVFICLLILFVGNFAQQQKSDVQDKEEEKIVKQQQPQEVPSAVLTTRKSVQKVDPPQNNAAKPIVNQLPASESASSAQLRQIPGITETTLAESTECKGDIQKYCVKGSTKPIANYKALQCVDDLDNAVNLISKECQNKIYKFKLSLTRNVRFDHSAMRSCSKDLKLLEDCNDHTDKPGTGRLIPCLYDLLENITDPQCRYFIQFIQATIFTDWRLSETFALACIDDISRLHCGRLDDDNDTLPHEQGAVVSCLAKSHTSLSKNCSKQISRLTEMQSDDYHLDRALYYACREDRERLCLQVNSGNGRVYRCLYEQKFNSMMSSACREEVHRRQKLIVSNALLDAPLVRACKNEMLEHKCVANLQDPEKKLSLTNLLLCLENRVKTGNQINDECRREMLTHRRMLMSDYAVSTKISTKCRDEMVEHCSSLYQQGASGSIDQRGGRMIHCLLKAAQQEQKFSPECLTSIKSLVRAVDPGSDIRADPLLETTCRPVIDALCPKIKSGDSNIIMCLLNNLKNNRMTDECEDRLMEISYFMVRDWRITPKLLGACRKNLVELCHLQLNWTMNTEMNDAQLGTYLSCLYRQKNQLTSDCRTELKQLMSIRSQSIGLMPEIQDNCITDLASCNNPEVKGEEIKCLQKKYAQLEEKCKSAIRNYTAITMNDPTLDFPLMKACATMITTLCPNIGGNNDNDVIRCLIRQKNNQNMDYRCKAAIEHRQIISMKDEAFLSEQFRKRCDREINEHCSAKKTKSAVVQCLAHLMLIDVVKKTNALTSECRDELKFELLQRGESIDLDPSLAAACQNDIRVLCPNQNPGNAQIIDCLKTNRNRVSSACYSKLTQREKVDVILPSNDYSLTTNCAPVIQKFCATENKQNILSCLRQNANRETTSIVCRKILYHRLMVLNTDARFNTALIENCQSDIHKYCSKEVIANEADDDQEDNEDDNDEINAGTNNNGEINDRDMGGRIIGCLRTHYANKNSQLESKCVTELVDVIQTSKLDVQLDVKLYQTCRKYLQMNCSGVEKEDCLKVLYQKNQIDDPACREQVVRIIKEGQADIYIDEALTTACRMDILKYCNDIPMGGGKQLQCLLKLGRLQTVSCQKVLSKREELWRTIPDVDNIDDLTRHIVHSANSRYLYSVFLLVLLCIFFAGCVCRSSIRRRRISKYR